jgi:uncharacterized protein
MHRSAIITRVLRLVLIFGVLYAVAGVALYFRQRSLLYFPTHAGRSMGLKPWVVDARTLGFCREVPNPGTIWLMAHGNAGEAADRDYVLPRMSDQDSLYVLEYPGYGKRGGTPTRESMNQAAVEAYRLLRARNPGTPVCALGESIGSGPTCALAREPNPPDKLVLVVPFDSLAHLASAKIPFFPIRLILRDRWDNVEALRGYRGPVDVFAARNDTVIPMAHAEALVRELPNAHFTAIPGGHNEWSECAQVKIIR